MSDTWQVKDVFGPTATAFGAIISLAIAAWTLRRSVPPHLSRLKHDLELLKLAQDTDSETTGIERAIDQALAEHYPRRSAEAFVFRFTRFPRNEKISEAAWFILKVMFTCYLALSAWFSTSIGATELGILNACTTAVMVVIIYMQLRRWTRRVPPHL